MTGVFIRRDWDTHTHAPDTIKTSEEADQFQAKKQGLEESNPVDTLISDF